VPVEVPLETAPTTPFPLRGGSIGEADRGEVGGASSDSTPSTAEAAPSGPPVSSPAQAAGSVEPSTVDAALHPHAGTVSPQAGRRESGKVTVAKAVEQKARPVAAPAPEPKKSWFQRMREGLARSSRELTGNIAGVFTKRKLDEDTLQDLEDILIRADLGVETALRVTDSLASSRYGKTISDEEVRNVMADEIGKVLTPVALPLELDLSHKPHVILVVGVNGTGKTTTIGKLAAKLTTGGLSVMLAAGDTFRAAAIEQLKIWGERTRSPVVATKLGADAAGLAYDAFEKAKEAGSDVLIIDTAGRLQNKAELMAELEKIVRVLGKLDPEAPHTVLQTVDATTGQNALNQVEIFRNVAGVNGLVMTKLDGTARGGILVAIAAKHKLPVYFIGVGEQVDDLEPFAANDFARAIAGVA
jgi:fused signal recognition particle receptor